MKRLCHMKESLIACVESQIANNLANVDTKELGAAIDMIKDLEESIYYCTITKAMNEDDEEEKAPKHQQMYQNGPYYPMYNDGSMYRDRDMNYPNHMERDNSHRSEMSSKYRRMYMEGKEKHHDSAKQMQDLESYIHELSNDIMEMIEDATQEEKQALRQKISLLATKIK